MSDARGSVQKEHGHSPIAHPILEALALAPFCAAELKVLLVIIRQTYGWSRRDAAISRAEFMAATGLGKSTVRLALQELEKGRVVEVVSAPTFREPGVYRLRKDPREWGGDYRCTPPSLDPQTQAQESDTGAESCAPQDLETGAESCASPGAEICASPGAESCASPASQVVESQQIPEAENNNKARESNSVVVADVVGAGEQARDRPPDLPEDRDGQIRYAIRSLNRGMIDNRRLDYPLPIPEGHGDSQQAILDWLDQGIPIELVVRVLYEGGKAFKPQDERRRGPTTAKYFTFAVRREWDQLKASTMEVSDGHDHDAGGGLHGRAAGELPAAALSGGARERALERFR